MLTKILISFGVAMGIAIAVIAITLIGVSIMVFTEKIIDNIKSNLGDKKFNNIKNFSLLISGVIAYIIIITYMTYKLLFVY